MINAGERKRARHSLLYEVYLHSSLWQLRRWLWWRKSGRCCEDCSRPIVLHRHQAVPGESVVMTVHHLTYERLGRERRADVLLLCWRCHNKRHWRGQRRLAVVTPCEDWL